MNRSENCESLGMRMNISFILKFNDFEKDKNKNSKGNSMRNE